MFKPNLNVLIADDELLARKGLEARLSAFSHLTIVSQYENGIDTLEGIKQHQPDAVFLDIEMPGLTGLELLEQLRAEALPMPFIVFTTAHESFALDAFNYEPCDYLLKPVNENRLELCLSRIEKTLMQQQAYDVNEKLRCLVSKKTGKTLDGFIDNLEHSGNCQLSDLQNYISLKSGSDWVKIALDDILWIEAVGDYMCLHLQTSGTPGAGTKESLSTTAQTHITQQIIRKTMKQLETELDKQRFPRVNRSAMINITKLEKLCPNSNGEYFAHLKSGQIIKVSRKYKFRLDELSARKSVIH